MSSFCVNKKIYIYVETQKKSAKNKTKRKNRKIVPQTNVAVTVVKKKSRKYSGNRQMETLFARKMHSSKDAKYMQLSTYRTVGTCTITHSHITWGGGILMFMGKSEMRPKNLKHQRQKSPTGPLVFLLFVSFAPSAIAPTTPSSWRLYLACTI